MKTFRIAVLAGDGIGPEVVAEGLKVLRAVEARLIDVRFQTIPFTVGAQAYREGGEAFPEEVFEEAASCDAILLGAMGLPDVRQPGGTEIAPQLDLRERLDLYAGVRPVKLFHATDCPLKGYAAGSIDFVVVRESTEGLFSSRRQQADFEAGEVSDQLRISRRGAERLFRFAFRMAAQRRGLLTLVDKANVLPSMVYFRRIFDEIAREFPQVRTERIYADAAALYFVQRPQAFDVVVTENMIGDILSDLAAGIVGGMGMAPSGDIGEEHAVFQPAHGSAPDLAGQGIANPIATILSVAMMLEWIGLKETILGAEMIREATARVLAISTQRTRDLGGPLRTAQMGDAIAEAVTLIPRGVAS